MLVQGRETVVGAGDLAEVLVVRLHGEAVDEGLDTGRQPRPIALMATGEQIGPDVLGEELRENRGPTPSTQPPPAEVPPPKGVTRQLIRTDQGLALVAPEPRVTELGLPFMEEEQTERGGGVTCSRGEPPPELGAVGIAGEMEERGEDKGSGGVDAIVVDETAQAGGGLGSVHNQRTGQIEVSCGLLRAAEGPSCTHPAGGADRRTGTEAIEGGVRVVLVVLMGEYLSLTQGTVDMNRSGRHGQSMSSCRMWRALASLRRAWRIWERTVPVLTPRNSAVSTSVQLRTKRRTITSC